MEPCRTLVRELCPLYYEDQGFGFEPETASFHHHPHRRLEEGLCTQNVQALKKEKIPFYELYSQALNRIQPTLGKKAEPSFLAWE